MHAINQIQRIKSKLIDAKRTDSHLRVFGASSHKYFMNSPLSADIVQAFEEKNSITLPDGYKTFILEIGNAGNSYRNSAAGPFYGIYPLGTDIDELANEKYLRNECILYPKMSDEYWMSLINDVENEDDLSDAEYEEAKGKIYGGILPIGSQGCSYLHGIVLNGKNKGRVINIDADRQKPKFCFEENFLDWYERWLDEVISGELIKDEPVWFGYHIGGSEEELLTKFLNSVDGDDQSDCLDGLLIKSRLAEQTIIKIESLINEHPEHNKLLIQILSKFDYLRAKPYLSELSKTDLGSVFKFVHWYAKDKSFEWVPTVENNIPGIVDDEETFRFCTYLLQNANIDFGNLLIPLTKSQNEDIRVTAYYLLGRLSRKK